VRPRVAQRLDHRREVVHLNREAVPPPGLLLLSVRHGLAASAGWIRRAEDQPKVASREHGERRSWVHDLVKSKVAAVELDRGVHVLDDVANLNRGHVRPLSPRVNGGPRSASSERHEGACQRERARRHRQTAAERPDVERAGGPGGHVVR
jgi:hypothetical protein